MSSAATRLTTYVQRTNWFVPLLVGLSAACSSAANQPCSSCAESLTNSAGAAGQTSGSWSGTTGQGSATTVGGNNAIGGVVASGGATTTLAVTGGTTTVGASETAGGTASATKSVAGEAGATVRSDWPPSCTTIAGSLAKELVARGALLLDVREPSEFSTGALPGAINIPRGSITSRLSELDINRPIVVYCQSGTRASLALTELCNAGYSVYSLGARSNWPS